jgi:hypothetical protein
MIAAVTGYRALDLALELLLLVTIALCAGGVLLVLILDPLAIPIALGGGIVIGHGIARLIGEAGWGGFVLGTVIAILGVGLYAVFLIFRLPPGWTAALALAVLALFVTVLYRAHVAYGSADR